MYTFKLKIGVFHFSCSNLTKFPPKLYDLTPFLAKNPCGQLLPTPTSKQLRLGVGREHGKIRTAGMT